MSQIESRSVQTQQHENKIGASSFSLCQMSFEHVETRLISKHFLEIIFVKSKVGWAKLKVVQFKHNRKTKLAHPLEIPVTPLSVYMYARMYVDCIKSDLIARSYYYNF